MRWVCGLVLASGVGACGGDSDPPDDDDMLSTEIGTSPDAFTNSTSATFVFSASVASATFECSVDGAPPTSCTSPFTVSSLSEGAHVFTVRAIGADGEEGQLASFNWTVDVTPPIVTITSGPDGLIYENTPTFEFSADESAMFSCVVDGAPFSCMSPTTLPSTPAGSYTFEVRATDQAGNVGAATRQFTISGGPRPAISQVLPTAVRPGDSLILTLADVADLRQATLFIDSVEVPADQIVYPPEGDERYLNQIGILTSDTISGSSFEVTVSNEFGTSLPATVSLVSELSGQPDPLREVLFPVIGNPTDMFPFPTFGVSVRPLKTSDPRYWLIAFSGFQGYCSLEPMRTIEFVFDEPVDSISPLALDELAPAFEHPMTIDWGDPAANRIEATIDRTSSGGIVENYIGGWESVPFGYRGDYTYRAPRNPRDPITMPSPAESDPRCSPRPFPRARPRIVLRSVQTGRTIRFDGDACVDFDFCRDCEPRCEPSREYNLFFAADLSGAVDSAICVDVSGRRCDGVNSAAALGTVGLSWGSDPRVDLQISVPLQLGTDLDASLTITQSGQTYASAPASCSVRLDSEPVTAFGSTTYSILAGEGACSSPLQSTTSSEQMTIDGTFSFQGAYGQSPVVKITGGPRGSSSFTNDRTPTFTFETSASMVECEVDNVATPCTSTTSLTTPPLNDGSHTILVRATDSFGNVGSTSSSFWVDTEPPEISISSGPNQVTVDNTPVFKFSPTSITTYECSLLGDFTPCDNPFQAPRLADGTYTFRVRGLDGAGNVSSIVRRDFTVQAEVPTGEPLDIATGGSVEVPLDFIFPYQGQSYTSAYVNSRGSITFGSGDDSPFPDGFELRFGRPRIAGLWDRELSPDKGGQILVDADASSFSLTYWDVPGSSSTVGNRVGNTFTMTLFPSGDIRLSYQGVTTDGRTVVGVGPGTGVADPGPTDLSEASSLSAIGVTYEEFFSSFDLSELSLDFAAP